MQAGDASVLRCRLTTTVCGTRWPRMELRRYVSDSRLDRTVRPSVARSRSAAVRGTVPEAVQAVERPTGILLRTNRTFRLTRDRVHLHRG